MCFCGAVPTSTGISFEGCNGKRLSPPVWSGRNHIDCLGLVLLMWFLAYDTSFLELSMQHHVDLLVEFYAIGTASSGSGFFLEVPPQAYHSVQSAKLCILGERWTRVRPDFKQRTFVFVIWYTLRISCLDLEIICATILWAAGVW